MQNTYWPGWLGGLLIGLYLLLQLRITGRALGCSTGYGNLCGLISRTPYFHRGAYAKLDNWRLWFALGLPLGGALGHALGGGTFELSLSMGGLYDGVLPESPALRSLYLLAGGLCMGLGARIAGGCQSGHSIAGLSLLAPSSLIASVGFFVGGIVSVQALFRIFGAYGG